MRMRNSTLILTAAVVAATASANAQTKGFGMHRRAVQSVVMNSRQPAIVAMPGVNDTFVPAKGIAPGTQGGTRAAQARATMQRLKAQVMKSRKTAAPKWASAKETSYMLSEDGTQWEFDLQNTYRYDADGRVSSIYTDGTDTDDDGNPVKTHSRTDITYTDDGRMLDQTLYSSDDGSEYAPVQRLSRTYDTVQPSLYTFMGYYAWDADNGTWAMTNQANRYSYTRDAYNNIVAATISAPYFGEWDDVRRVTNTVDPATKQINSFKYETYGYDGNGLAWSEDQYFTDMKWKQTNGQVVLEYEEDPSHNWFNGGNYLQSATMSATGADGKPATWGSISVTYDDNGGYTEKRTYVYSKVYNGTVYKLDCKSVYTVSMTDDNGSFEIEETDMGDYDGDGVFTAAELDYHGIERVTYDAHGNLVSDLVYCMPDKESGNGDREAPAARTLTSGTGSDTDVIDATDALEYKGLVLMEGGLNIYQYDASHGDAEKQFITYDFDGEASFVPHNKVVVDEYTDLSATGISGVAQTAGQPSAVYTLEGVRVNAAPSQTLRGAYIVKDGGSVKKIMVK